MYIRGTKGKMRYFTPKWDTFDNPSSVNRKKRFVFFILFYTMQPTVATSIRTRRWIFGKTGFCVFSNSFSSFSKIKSKIKISVLLSCNHYCPMYEYVVILMTGEKIK